MIPDSLLEKHLKIRRQLEHELLHPSLWYDPNKEKNKDTIVIHPECPFATPGTGKVPEHRYVWWLHHKNETIEYNEVIHHINGDHKDNRIENLEKLKIKQHRKKHTELRKLKGSS